MFVAFAILRGICTIHSFMKKATPRRELEATVTKPEDATESTSRKSLEEETPAKPEEEVKCQMRRFDKGVPAVLAIEGIINSTSLVLYPASKILVLTQATVIVDQFSRDNRVDDKKANKLTLSGVSITIDIPPSLPQQSEDADIVHLSQLLERW